MMNKLKVKFENESGYIDGYTRNMHGYPVAAIFIVTPGKERIVFARPDDFEIVIDKPTQLLKD